MPLAENAQLLFRNLHDSPLGRLAWAGSIQNSVGTGRPRLRQFGRYALVYLLDGGGRYEDCQGRRIPVSAGDLITVFPDLAHRYGPAPGDPWSELYLVFEGPVFDLWRLERLLDDRLPVRSIRPSIDWGRRIETLIAYAAGGNNTLAQVGELQTLLVDMVGPSAAVPAADSDPDWLDRAQQLLVSSKQPLQQVASAMGTRCDAFRKRFTRLAGCTPGRYRNESALDRATEWLQHSELTLRDIAGRCGFCDEFHLSRAFRRSRGMSPSEYRRRHQPATGQHGTTSNEECACFG